MLCSYASVGEDKLKTLQSLEKEIGQTLLAFNCHQASPAKLTSEQLKRLQEQENELGMILVAI